MYFDFNSLDIKYAKSHTVKYAKTNANKKVSLEFGSYLILLKIRLLVKQ